MIINKHINLSPINIKLMSWSFLLSLDDIFGSSSKQQTSTMGHSTTSVSFDQVRKQIVVMITIFVLMCWPELINTCMLECLNGISLYKLRSSFPLSKVPTLFMSLKNLRKLLIFLFWRLFFHPRLHLQPSSSSKSMRCFIFVG